MGKKQCLMEVWPEFMSRIQHSFQHYIYIAQKVGEILKLGMEGNHKMKDLLEGNHKMKDLLELELRSYPGILINNQSKSALELKFVTETGLSQWIISPLGFISDPVDVINLAMSIDEGELKIEDFLFYCGNNNLTPNINNTDSAYKFLCFSYGQPIAWLHLPTEDGRLEYNLAVIMKWAKSNSFSVIDTDQLYCFVNYKGGQV
jgi:hypothetical protein